MTYLIETTMGEMGNSIHIFSRDKEGNKKIEVIFDPLQTKQVKLISVEELQKFIEENHATVNIAGTIFLGHDKKESIFYLALYFHIKCFRLWERHS